MWFNLSNVCGSKFWAKLILSNTCGSLLSKKVFECNIMTTRLYTIILSWSILFEIEKYDCKIIVSWTDYKSKLDQQCKQTLNMKKCLCIINPNKKYVP